jgi:uncharacterized protein (DUF39 family)
MAKRSATSATFSWNNTTVAAITDISFSSDGNDVDVTGLSDAKHVFEGGIPTDELTVDLNGYTTSLARGDTGSAQITWDGTNTSKITSARVSSVEYSASLDGAITTSLTLRPRNT